jgi:hypothetical protein
MARGTDAEAEVLLGGACVIDRAAGADDLAFHILGVDIGFHGKVKATLIHFQSKYQLMIQWLLCAVSRMALIALKIRTMRAPRRLNTPTAITEIMARIIVYSTSVCPFLRAETFCINAKNGLIRVFMVRTTWEVAFRVPEFPRFYNGREILNR